MGSLLLSGYSNFHMWISKNNPCKGLVFGFTVAPPDDITSYWRGVTMKEILTAALAERKIDHMLEHKYYRYPSSEDKVGEWADRVLELMFYHDDFFD